MPTKLSAVRWCLKGLIPAVLAAAVFVEPAAAGFVMDFDTDSSSNPIVAGQIIDSEYSGFGVTITTVNVAGGPSLGVAFDSGNALTAAAVGDPDLLTPGSVGNAKNKSYDNILVIQENGSDTDPPLGFLDPPTLPNDEGGNPAGSLTFDFDDPINQIAFALVDVQAGEFDAGGGANGSVMASLGAGPSHQIPFADFPTLDPSVTYGNNSVNRIVILASDFGVQGFDRFDQFQFKFGGSAGLAHVSVPEPTTVLVLSGGLLGFLAYRRRH